VQAEVSSWQFAPPVLTARCGENIDYSFVFQGVTIESRVGCKGCSPTQGPQGVTVTLEGKTTTSDSAGRWQLAGITPGQHTLTCTRGTWHYEATVTVEYDGSVTGI
jgi:hypothetical protein